MLQLNDWDLVVLDQDYEVIAKGSKRSELKKQYPDKLIISGSVMHHFLTQKNIKKDL